MKLGEIFVDVFPELQTSAFNAEMQRLSRRVVRVKVETVLDSTTVQAQLNRIKGLTVKVKAEIDGSGIQRELNRRRYRVRVDVDYNDRGGPPGGRNRGGGFGGGGAGFSVASLAGITSATSLLPRLASTATVATVAVASLAPALLSASAAGAGLVPILGSLGQGFGAIVLGANNVVGALKASSAASDAAGASAKSFAGAQKSALAGVASAQRAVTASREGLANAIISSDRGIRSALRSQVQAERGLRDAQRASLRAQENLNDARKEAKRDLEDLAAATRGNALDERQAILDVANAQQELNEARLAGEDTFDEQLNLDQAKEGLSEVRREASRLAEEQAEAAKDGVEGSERVKSAREGVRDALQAEADAVEGVKDANRGVSEAQVDGAQSVAAAQRGVDDALLGVVAAQGALTDATNMTSAAQDKYAEALAKLGPNQRAFVDEVERSKPAFEALQRAIGERLFLGLDTSLRQLTTQLLPEVQVELVKTAGIVNDTIRDLVSALVGPLKGEFTDALKLNNEILALTGPIVVDLMEIFLRLYNAAGPLAKDMVGALADATDRFAEFLRKADESGALTQFFEDVKKDALQIGRIIGNVVGGVSALFGIKPTGELLDNIEGITEAFERFSENNPGLGAKIVGIALGFRVLGLIPFAAIGAGIRAVAGGVALLAGSAALGPLAGIAAGVLAIGGAFVYAYQNSPALREAVDGLKGEFEDFLAVFEENNDQGGVRGFMDGITAAVTEEGPDIAVALAGIGSEFVSFIADQVPLAIDEVRRLFNEMTTWIDNGGVQQVYNSMKELGNELWEWVEPQIGPTAHEIGKWLAEVLIALSKAFFDMGAWIITDGIPKFISGLDTLESDVSNWVLREGIPGVGSAAKGLATGFIEAWQIEFVRSDAGKDISLWIARSLLAAREAARLGVVAIKTLINELFLDPIRTVFQFVGLAPPERLSMAGGSGVFNPATSTSTRGGVTASAAGGLLSGPGSGTSDDILGIDPRTYKATSYVSNGEYVVRESSVKKYGTGFLNEVNQGKFASGGLVGGLPALFGGGLVDKVRGWIAQGASAATSRLFDTTATSFNAAGAPPIVAQLATGLVTTLQRGIGNIIGVKEAEAKQVANVSGPTSVAADGELSSNALAAKRAVLARFGNMSIGGWGLRPNATEHDDYIGGKKASRALDFMTRDLARGNAIADMMNSFPGATYSIWQRRIRRAGGDWRPYSGRSPHTDHVHTSYRAKGGLLNPHVRDMGGPLLPGYTFNGTSRNETVLPNSYRTGGLVKLGDTTAPGNYFATVQAGVAAGYDSDELQKLIEDWQEAAMAAKAYKAELAAVGAMMSAEAMVKASKTPEEYATNMSILNEKTAAYKALQVDEQWRREQVAASALISEVNRLADAHQKAKDAADDAMATVNKYLSVGKRQTDLAADYADQLDPTFRGGLVANYNKQLAEDLAAEATLQANHNAGLLKAQRDFNTQVEELVEGRAKTLRGTATKRIDLSGFIFSPQQMLRIAAQNNATLARYDQALKDGASRGLSADVLEFYGISGPEQTKSLERILAGPQSVIDDMLGTFETSVVGSREVAETEQKLGFGALGDSLVSAATSYNNTVSSMNTSFGTAMSTSQTNRAAAYAEHLLDLKDLEDKFLEDQKLLIEEFADIGRTQAERWALAVAAGIDSGIPEAVAAAKRLNDAVNAEIAAGAAAAAGPTSSYTPPVRTMGARLVGYTVGSPAWVNINGQRLHLNSIGIVDGPAGSQWVGRYGTQVPGAKTYDNGGWLERGASMVQNSTGKREAVLTPEESATLKKIAGQTRQDDPAWALMMVREMSMLRAEFKQQTANMKTLKRTGAI